MLWSSCEIQTHAVSDTVEMLMMVPKKKYEEFSQHEKLIKYISDGSEPRSVKSEAIMSLMFVKCQD